MPYAFKVPDNEVFEVNILSVNADKVSRRGQVVFTLNDEEVRKEEKRETRYYLGDNDVTERKPEFKSAEKLPDGSLREMSTTCSDSIVVNAVKPFNILDKGMIPKQAESILVKRLIDNPYGLRTATKEIGLR